MIKNELKYILLLVFLFIFAIIRVMLEVLNVSRIMNFCSEYLESAVCECFNDKNRVLTNKSFKYKSLVQLFLKC